MIVCICHQVSDRDIEREVRDGCDSFDTLETELRVATACGACRDCARNTFERACVGVAVARPARVHLRLRPAAAAA